MDHHLGDGATAPPLLAPTAALRRGFEFAPEAAPASAAPSARTDRIEGAQARQGFRIGSLALMIPYAEGSELTDLPTVYRLPNAPAWMLGMANLHGMLVPVFDLARRFGIERPAPTKPMLLVLAHGAHAAGVVIDSLPQRLRFDADALVEADTVPDALRGVVLRSALIEQQLWFDLDCTALLAALEQSFAAAQ